MSERAYYAAAIDILTDPNVDFRLLCIAIAKTDPKVLVVASGKKTVETWQLHAAQEYSARGKIAAIKLIRNATGMGLKEAKEEIERLMESSP